MNTVDDEPRMIKRFASALRGAGLDFDWRDLADLLWVADVRARADEVSLRVQGDGEGSGAGGPAPTQLKERDDQPESGGGRAPADHGDGAATTATPPETETDIPAVPTGWQIREGADAREASATLEPVTPMHFALPGAQEIGRAMRPLKQRRRTPRRRVFDPEATVDLFCDTKILIPVLSAGSERWFDVAIVADTSATMAIWEETIAALADLLERHGAFRGVSRWALAERNGKVEVVTPSGHAHAPRELLDMAGRRLLLVVTDGVGAMWTGHSVWEALDEWGRYGPVAVAQVLPERSWAQTQLGEADAAVSASRPGQPNSQLDVAPPWWWGGIGAPVNAIPVVGLDEGTLGPWARMVMGATGVSVPSVLAGPVDNVSTLDSVQGALRDHLEHEEADLDRLGNVLRSTVSAQAYQLAVLLSAVDVSLPIAHIVMHQLMPEARLAHLAELVAAGVLRAGRTRGAPRAESEGRAGRPRRTEVTLNFAGAGVRTLLQRSLTVTTMLQVWRAIAPYLETAHDLARFTLLLQPYDATPEGAAGSDADPTLEGMRTVAADLAARLGLHSIEGATTTTVDSTWASRAATSQAVTVLVTDSPMRELAAIALPDERTLLAGGSDDGSVRLWDSLTGRPIGGPLTGHTGWVGALAAIPLPDGRVVLASGAADQTVRLWDPLTGTIIHELLTGHGSRVRALAAISLPDGRVVLASGAADQTVRLWNPLTGVPISEPLIGHTAPVRALAAVPLPHGRVLLASGADDQTIRLWDPFTGVPISEPLIGHTAPVRALAAVPLPDGRVLLASGADDQTIRLWDPLTGVPISEPLTGHTAPVRALAAMPLPDGRVLLASGADDQTIRLWDPFTGVPISEPLTGHTAPVRALAAIPQSGGSSRLASTGGDGTIRVWAAPAVPLLEQALAGRERVLGPDHPDSLTARNALAEAYRAAGDLSRALPLLEQTLAGRERVLGPDDPDTLTTRNALAEAYRAAGDLSRALPLLEQTLAGRERVLGPDHPDSLTTRNALAEAYRAAGDLSRAIPLLEQTLAGRERVLGPDDPDTLTTRNALAGIYLDSKDFARAVPALEQILAARQRVLGPDHPDTLASLNLLAETYHDAGDVARALSLLTQLHEEQVRVLGPDHPDTLRTRANTGRWTGEAGDLTGAIALLTDLLDDQIRALGPDHPDTLDTRTDIANWRRVAEDPYVAPPEIWHLSGQTSQLVIGRDVLIEAVGEASRPETRVRGIRVKRMRPTDDVSSFGLTMPILEELLVRSGENHLLVPVAVHAPVSDLADEIATAMKAVGVPFPEAWRDDDQTSPAPATPHEIGERAAVAAGQAASSTDRLTWFYFQETPGRLTETTRSQFEAFVGACLAQPHIRLVVVGFETVPLAGLEFSGVNAVRDEGLPGMVVEYVGEFTYADVLNCLTRAAAHLAGSVDPGQIEFATSAVLGDLESFNGRYDARDLPSVNAGLQPFLKHLRSSDRRE